jgi:5-methylcytosine-specific restriction endonuclease McrA
MKITIRNEDELEEWIKQLVGIKQVNKFYKCNQWLKVKGEVLDEQKRKCQECLKAGKVTEANTVHHVQFVKKYPRLALSKYYNHNGKQYRNLIAVCPECHNKLHPEKIKKKKDRFINDERW